MRTLPARVSGLNGNMRGETIIRPVNGGVFGPNGRRGGRAALLLFTISALLFVAIQSRVAQRLPTRSPEELLTSFSDPVKMPPPEERSLENAWAIIAAAVCVFAALPALPFAEVRRERLAPRERYASATLLRAPPASL
jgi:hypothetical protein